MDAAVLVDVGVAIATALCFGLLVYGAWLCLQQFRGSRPKQKPHEVQSESEAVVRAPRPRVRAGIRGG